MGWGFLGLSQDPGVWKGDVGSLLVGWRVGVEVGSLLVGWRVSVEVGGTVS